MDWKSTGSPYSILINNQLVTKAFNVAEEINKFFHQKIADIRKSINEQGWTPDACEKVRESKKCKLFLNHISKPEVLKIIRGLSNSKCTSIDGLNNFGIKIAADVILDPLHHIITLSLMQEKFPSQWKKAKVIPLHKTGDTLMAKNYRPVSILSPLSKVLEKVVCSQVYHYFTINKILHPSLHGYRKNRSTLTSLLEMYHKWVEAASHGQVSGAVMLDLSAAFDLVSTDILLKKLRIYGLQRDFLDWMKDYMSDRQQSVWIDHKYSNLLPCEAGVPQGSILGPLIFLIFVNDLPSTLTSNMDQYADDSTISLTSQDSQETSVILTRDCEKVSSWMNENRLKINPDKTHILTLGTDHKLKKPENEIAVSMDGLDLEKSSNSAEKLLGCYFQANLKWTKQIDNVKSKLAKRIAGLSTLKKPLPNNIMKII